MKIGILGSGMVGNAIATKLVRGGHAVMMGSRTANREGGQKWASSAGAGAKCGTFADAAAFGEVVFNCTNGANSLAALRLAGGQNLRGKILVDVANPLEMEPGKAPRMTVCNEDSLGEQIQREFPEARVVKTFNTMNCEVMVNPSLVPGDHNVFVCGNDAAAKKQVSEWLVQWFGWKAGNIVDLGDITAARGTEMFLILWLRLWGAVGSPQFNVGVVKG